MKTSLLLSVLFITFSNANACLKFDDNYRVCPGDKVYSGTYFSEGAEVLSVNQVSKTATVRSIHNGYLFEEALEELFISKKCIEKVCVGSQYYVGTKYSNPVTLLGFNPLKKLALVVSTEKNELYEEKIKNLDLTVGCIWGVCVGDIIMNKESQSRLMEVIALNLNSKTIVLKSPKNEIIQLENSDGILIHKPTTNYSSKTREISMNPDDMKNIIIKVYK